MHKTFTIFFLSIFLCGQLFAQNLPELPPKCHHAGHHIHTAPLTASEILELRRGEARSDSFDIFNYNISLEVIDFENEIIWGHCAITLSPLIDGIPQVTLDLESLNIDSVTGPNGLLNYSYDDRFLKVDMPTSSSSDTTVITVFYNGTPTVDPTDFGGFDFNGGYAYNLGIGLGSNPYNFGRSWFPCFDNFVERSTYDFQITTADGRKGYCIGTFLGETQVIGDTITRSYRMSQEIPTYQAGVAVSNYREVRGMHQGTFGSIPTLLLSKPEDTTNLVNSFVNLGAAIDAMEYWYGPYPWERVGYVMTVRGAMEHPTLIAYPEFTGTGGQSEGQDRLMAHELCHHWWGDVVNGSTAADMWFKEGNAEYGAHLFTEFLFGKDDFLRQVRNNHLSVMTNAHFDDDGYWPLSGIPFEHTYGTHTYYKGASMIHNMRAYMGDSLFRVGQQAMLNEYAFSAVDAKQYQDLLSNATGLDMSDYFNAWIFNPGYAAYEIDSVQLAEDGMDYIATVYIEQKLRAAPNYHRNAPLELTFVGENWEEMTVEVMTDGQQSVAEVRLPFKPLFQMVNKDHQLNIAQMSSVEVATERGNLSSALTDFRVTVREINPGDSAMVAIEHYWVEADALDLPREEARVSSNHFWRYNGIFPEGFRATGRLEYDGITKPYHDLDLLSVTEDSIILVYRPDASVEWREFPYYRVTNPVEDDKKGIVRLDSLLVGDYAFANGPLPLYTNTVEPAFSEFEIFPNPTRGQLSLRGTLTEARDVVVELFDLQGRQLYQQALGQQGQNFQYSLDLAQIPNGLYLLKVADEQGHILRSEKIEFLR
ncbi:MAG: M1 family aminopeptidase [Bacteroidota bacterium]